MLVVGLLTMYSMTKIWLEAFWKPHPHPAMLVARGAIRGGRAAGCATALLAAVTLWIGLWPQPLLAYARAAAVAFTGPAAR